MSVKVVKLGLSRSPGDLLYIKRTGTSDKNEIWRRPKVGTARVTATTTFARQKGMLYFIDADGDVSSSPCGKRAVKAAPLAKKQAKSSVYVSLVFDKSVSMKSIRAAAEAMFNKTIASVKAGANADRMIFISMYWFGSSVDAQYINLAARSAPDVYGYSPNDGSTCLLDAVSRALSDAEMTRARTSADASFVISVITDGEENSSSVKAARLARDIARAQATDKYTLTFMLPRGAKAQFCREYSISEGNVEEWDTTSAGADRAGAASQTGFGSYWAAHSTGVRSVKTFYADASKITASDVKKLADVTPIVEAFTAKTESSIRELCEAKTRRQFKLGEAFYQLMKPEKKVQDYKQILLRDKASQRVYGGPLVRAHLGLPSSGDCAVKPGNHGNFDIFIQSTSVNRIIPRGTDVICWPGAVILNH